MILQQWRPFTPEKYNYNRISYTDPQKISQRGFIFISAKTILSLLFKEAILFISLNPSLIPPTAPSVNNIIIPTRLSLLKLQVHHHIRYWLPESIPHSCHLQIHKNYIISVIQRTYLIYFINTKVHSMCITQC